MNQGPMKWRESDTFNPAATLAGDRIAVLFRSEDNTARGIGSRTSRIGYAESEDGFHMTFAAEPVLYPAEDCNKAYEWPGGCEDPRVAVTEDGLYVMMYTSWNRDMPRLCVATSRDLKNWDKHGYAFEDALGDRNFGGCKSASVVTEIRDGRLVIAKPGGKYLMYWGERFVNLATSDDLIHWVPQTDAEGNLVPVMSPRDGHFDSMLTECGPPAILTDKGIVLMYNGKNRDDERRDERYTAATYSAGQALFDRNDPYKLITRLDEPFFKPEADFEKTGQYPAGTVFIEGLVLKNGRWFLYYGCADSFVGVAVCDKSCK
ncbi:MAG: hypothetical protein HUJ94_04085 [Bacteroidales bacterium]|nr:hypothetical protein [Bacteroidales bacterium]